MSENQAENISQAPVSVLFNPNTIAKKDVWEINIVQILEILIHILKKADKKRPSSCGNGGAFVFAHT